MGNVNFLEQKSKAEKSVKRKSPKKLDASALRLKNGKAKTKAKVAAGIAKVLDKQNLWNSIKMMIADTTSVNTGKKNGVVAQLHRMFSEEDFNKTRFIYRILRVVMDKKPAGSTKSPNIEYPIVSELLKKYLFKSSDING